MITEMAHVALLVNDYDEAKSFYQDKLGFHVVEDIPQGAGKRWLRLRPPGGKGSDLLLARAEGETQRAAVGRQAAGRVWLFFFTDDFDADYAAFRARGVKFTDGPRDEVYGRVGVFEDLYGNRIDLIGPVPGK